MSRRDAGSAPRPSRPHRPRGEPRRSSDWSSATVSARSGACRPRWTAKRTGRSSGGTSSGAEAPSLPFAEPDPGDSLSVRRPRSRAAPRRPGSCIIPGRASSRARVSASTSVVRLERRCGCAGSRPSPSPPRAGLGSGPRSASGASRGQRPARAPPQLVQPRQCAAQPPLSGCTVSPASSASASTSRAAGAKRLGDRVRAAARPRSRGRTRSR